MPRITNALFQQEVVKLEQDQLLHLVKIQLPYISVSLPDTVIYLVDDNENVDYLGQTYTAFPMQFSGGFTMSSDGSVDKATLELANPERILMPYINSYSGLKDTTVTVYTIYKKFLSTNPTAVVTDYFEVDSYTANDTVLTLTLDPSADFNVKLPRGQFMANTCRFRYKDPITCKYSGPLSTCFKTLADCKLHITELNSTGTVNKGTAANGNSVFWGPNFSASLKPGYVIQVSGNKYTIQSVGVSVKLNNSSVVNNAIVVVGSTIADATGLDYQLFKGNQKNFGGFPGVPTTVRTLVI